MLLLSLTQALALTCATGDIPCEQANAVAAIVNAHQPNLIDDAQPVARYNTNTIRTDLQSVHDGINHEGCTAVGVTAGVYGVSAWDGGWQDAATSGDASGTLDRTAKTLQGTYGGDASGTIGDLYSNIVGGASGTVAANRDFDQGEAGYYRRINGKRGFFYTVHATCELPVPGCTDPIAINFDPSATVDDGSCVYPDPCVIDPGGPECCIAEPGHPTCDPCINAPGSPECCSFDPFFPACDPCFVSPGGPECCGFDPGFPGCDPCILDPQACLP